MRKLPPYFRSPKRYLYSTRYLIGRPRFSNTASHNHLLHPKPAVGSSRRLQSTSSKSPVSHSKSQYVPLENVENLEEYCPGGYHPMNIGDYLHDRYRIVHKLGFGTHSTIWLARDRMAGGYVAIKVAVASGDQGESNVLRLLGVEGTKKNAHPGQAVIQPILDEFYVRGPNGRHRCFVTIPAKTSLSSSKKVSKIKLFQLSTSRAITAQLALAMAFMHSRGAVHCDLHLGNILLRFPKSIDNLSPEEFYDKYGKPDKQPVARVDRAPLPEGIPTHGVKSACLGKKSEHISLSDAGIFLSDFGEAFLPSMNPRYYSRTPGLLVPPEIYFEPKQPVSFPADIWTLACTIWEIIGQRALFEGTALSVDWMIKEHVDTLGELPSEWWKKWDSRQEWFDEDGKRKDHQGPRRTWDERFEACVQQPRRQCGLGEFGEEEKAALFVMLKSMMKFEPEKRLTAEQILNSEWMTKWGLPEYKKMLDIQ